MPGLDRPGRDAVDADAPRRQLPRQRLGERDHAALRRGVGGVALEPAQPDLRRDRDDPPAPPCEHPGQRRLDDVPGAGEVDVEHAPPVILRRPFRSGPVRWMPAAVTTTSGGPSSASTRATNAPTAATIDDVELARAAPIPAGPRSHVATANPSAPAAARSPRRDPPPAPETIATRCCAVAGLVSCMAARRPYRASARRCGACVKRA